MHEKVFFAKNLWQPFTTLLSKNLCILYVLVSIKKCKTLIAVKKQEKNAFINTTYNYMVMTVGGETFMTNRKGVMRFLSLLPIVLSDKRSSQLFKTNKQCKCCNKKNIMTFIKNKWFPSTCSHLFCLRFLSWS